MTVYLPQRASRPAVAMAMRLRVCAFMLTLMLSAGLLFAVQPMFAKMALPLFGGSPAVWNTSMLFFQAALLLGYAYAHWISSRLSIRQQVGVHAALLLAAMFTLPIGVPVGWNPGPGDHPGLILISTMVLALGAPFVVVSATAPLLQNWFGKGALTRTDDPYFLYAASNFGSLTALLAYPVAIEPLLDLHDQSSKWSAGFVLLVGLVVGCGLAALKGAVAVDGGLKFDSHATAPVSFGRRLHWIALSLRSFQPAAQRHHIYHNRHCSSSFAMGSAAGTLSIVLCYHICASAAATT